MTDEVKSEPAASAKVDEEPEEHLVNFTISVEHVFNVDDEGKLPAEAMKSWQYYHVEYNLQPNKPSAKADVVMSGMVAKMYSDLDTRLLKTRTDGDKQYVMWSHKHPISVTKALLLDMFSHTVNIRFWDTKDKVSVRAKFDRPKVFRLPPPPGPKPVDARFDGGGTAQSNARRHLQLEKSMTSGQKVKSSSSETKVDNKMSSTDLTSTTPTEIRRRKMEKDMVSEYGKCVLSVPLSSLFAGNTVLFAHSEPCQHFTALKQVIVKISLNKPLMSLSLSKELCPMKLNIVKSKNNPNAPVTYKQLTEQCDPVFARYQFLGEEQADTEGVPHAKDITWNHQHVILLGVLSRAKLEEFLTGPPFEVELHDRDRRADIIKPLPKIFDIHGNEEHLFDTSGKSKALGPPGIPWDSYGIAKFDLSPLLLGEDKLRLKSPVLPCVRPVNSNRTNVLKTGPRLDDTGSLPCGRYIESGTVITVELSLAHPLVQHTNYLKLTNPSLTTDSEKIDCPFGRIVYSMPTSASELLNKIIDQVLETNVKIFSLDNLPREMYISALSTYKLTKTQLRSTTLDYITGFHMLDGQQHLLVLEGTAGGSIARIWEENPKTHGQFKVLYNSELKFSERLYSLLSPDIMKVKLFEPLVSLVKHPSLYVRGSVSREAYDGLIRLSDLTAANLLLSCSRNDSFPTGNMIKLVAMEFGVPHSLLHLKKTAKQSKETIQSKDTIDTLQSEPKRQGGTWTPIDNYNKEYIEKPSRASVDFLYQNMEKVRAKSDLNAKKNTKIVKISCDESVGHNYSSSTKNSTELAKRKIRSILAEKPGERFTYSQEYACQTVSPRCVQEETEKEREKRIAGWRTREGFLFPAHRTALQSNQHCSTPHYTRVEQLREPWEENVLHAGKLKPTVDWKTFSWNERGLDFRTPRRVPTPSHPVTIHLPGKRRAEELQLYTSEEERKWRSKLVVENEIFAVHRTAPAVELKTGGPGAASQQDKAGSILKDTPAKLSLSAPRLKLSPIPAVDVVNYPRIEEDEKKVFQPGPHGSLSWSREHNAIPVIKDGKTGQFSLYFTPHSALAKLAIKPLSDKEKVGHLWQTSAN